MHRNSRGQTRALPRPLGASVGTADNLDDHSRPLSDDSCATASIGSVDKELLKRRVLFECIEYYLDTTIPILDVCRMNMDSKQKTERIGHDVAFAPLDLLTCVIPEDPPFSAVLTD